MLENVRWIHVTGESRTGTTLMKNLMICFDDVWVHPGEIFPSKAKDGGRLSPRSVNHKSIIVTKQPGGGNHVLQDDVEMLWMIRDPRDTWCSIHGMTADPKDLTSTPFHMHGYEQHRRKHIGNPLGGIKSLDPRVLIVKYEDLVTAPLETQIRIASHYKLVPRIPFTEGYREFPSEKRDRIQKAMNGIRPPDSNSIGRWKMEEYRDQVDALLEQFPQIKEDIIRFGYEI